MKNSRPESGADPGALGAATDAAMSMLTLALGGEVALFDRDGTCIRRWGDEPPYPGETDERALVALEQGCLVDSRAVYVRTAAGVLRMNAGSRLEREKSLKAGLEEILPMIAQVVGGEAVIFDHDGRRLSSVNPDGTTNNQYIGKVSEAARDSMACFKPLVGRSMSMPGAMAVRIPLTLGFGLGFNNMASVRQKTDLLNEIKKHKNVRFTMDDIIGESPAMKACKRTALMAARSDSTVLLWGETGTGKELFAQAIHAASGRSDGPFVALNCSAVPPSLMESTFFGYEKGAFTGAKSEGHPGVFELADGGTLYLDEISEMDIGIQAKLLRVLQEREVLRVGGTRSRTVNVRVIASTNRDLRKMVDEGRFREDLYYRLNVIDLKIPPLRERHGDVMLLATYFMHKYNVLFGKFVHRIAKEAMTALEEYTWPGNVRELQNCMERAMNWVNGDSILPQHLPPLVGKRVRLQPQALRELVREYERTVILETLQAHRSRVDAARSLGVSVTTLWRKMRDLEIEPAE